MRKAAGLRLVPPVACFLEDEVLRLQADKHGAHMWAEHGVVASAYYDAMTYHMMSWWTGEDNDVATDLNHLAHVRACTGIVLDCQLQGIMRDDRPKKISHPLYRGGD
jgi:hypothetical protein